MFDLAILSLSGNETNINSVLKYASLEKILLALESYDFLDKQT